jgi:hypothetical protein
LPKAADVNRAGRRTVACGLCSRWRKLPHVDFSAVMHGSSKRCKMREDCNLTFTFFYIYYVVAIPQLTHVVRCGGSDSRRPRVVGVTSVDRHRLYVLCDPSKQHIEVYDKKTSKWQQSLIVDGLSDDSWNGLTACVTNNCLYVNDWGQASIYKIQLSDDNQVTKWAVDGLPSGLSTNAAGNLLVACWSPNKLLEYAPSGSLVREISLQTTADWGTRHAIQLTDDQFVVSFCRQTVPSSGKVVVVNSEGQIVTSCEDYRFSQPLRLVVDNSNKYILVADHHVKGIVMLNLSLKYSRSLNMSLDGSRVQYPRCLHLDSSLYVGDSDGRIFVLDIRRC